MGKIMPLEERIKRGSIDGFAQLYRTLVTIALPENTPSELLNDCYVLYTAFIDTIRFQYPLRRIAEVDFETFERIMSENQKYYLTGVQHNKALQFLLNHIHLSCLTGLQQTITEKYQNKLDSTVKHFRAIMGIHLISRESTYYDCVYSLIAAENQPKSNYARGTKDMPLNLYENPEKMRKCH